MESINIYLMILTIIHLLLTDENWNTILSWILFTNTFLLPIAFYFYLCLKYLFPDRYEKKDEGCISKVVYCLRRRLKIKFEKLKVDNGIDQEKEYVFSEELKSFDDLESNRDQDETNLIEVDLINDLEIPEKEKNHGDNITMTQPMNKG